MEKGITGQAIVQGSAWKHKAAQILRREKKKLHEWMEKRFHIE